MLSAGLRLSRRLAKCILFLVADLHGSGRAKGAMADGKRIGPPGFGVRPPSAAFERFVAAKAVEGHRIPGRWRVVPAARWRFLITGGGKTVFCRLFVTF